jgi:hypothetical protein
MQSRRQPHAGAGPLDDAAVVADDEEGVADTAGLEVRCTGDESHVLSGTSEQRRDRAGAAWLLRSRTASTGAAACRKQQDPGCGCDDERRPDAHAADISALAARCRRLPDGARSCCEIP